MSKLRLHLDADTSIKALHTALLKQGHDVTRTPNAWMPADASDVDQLLGATAQDRCIFTFNIRDFVVLTNQHPNHAGIILAAQTNWSLSALIVSLNCLLTETQTEELIAQVRWLNDWSFRDSSR